MPELPEVERARRQLESIAVGRRIDTVWCAEDDIVFDGVTPESVRAALTGRTVQAVHRRGKYLWFLLDSRPWPIFHFGMTGAFCFPDREILPLESSAKEPDTRWPPRFTKILIQLDSGDQTAMTNARRLGRIRLRDDPATEPPITKLGFDPLLDLPTGEQFHELLGRRRANLKGLLLNQSFAAGVGNWIADEVLYQASIDPRRRSNDLSRIESGRLLAALDAVITTSVAVDAEKKRLPSSWLFHRRWGKDLSATTEDGEAVEFLTLAGRTTAWVPSSQR